jgi:hypothetical protein
VGAPHARHRRGIYELPSSEARTGSYPNEFIVDYVRGYGRS